MISTKPIPIGSIRLNNALLKSPIYDQLVVLLLNHKFIYTNFCSRLEVLPNMSRPTIPAVPTPEFRTTPVDWTL
jgi:hypothetical protein